MQSAENTRDERKELQEQQGEVILQSVPAQDCAVVNAPARLKPKGRRIVERGR